MRLRGEQKLPSNRATWLTQRYAERQKRAAVPSLHVLGRNLRRVPTVTSTALHSAAARRRPTAHSGGLPGQRVRRRGVAPGACRRRTSCGIATRARTHGGVGHVVR
eukprot:scaffold5668_cov111-Isochrysis_galbana.AAC.25